MKKQFVYMAITLMVLIGAVLGWKKATKQNTLAVVTPPGNEHYIGKINITANTSVRLLVLKHCRENIADRESTAVIRVANFAATKGLSIKDLGQHHVDKNGKVQGNFKVVWGKTLTLDNLKDFISQQMKVNAELGDTLIIYTTGHGSPGGNLQILGPRELIARILAQAAEENKQETIWWQSSCYASSGLPEMSTFTPKQQSLFTMIASSTADKSSYWGDQTEPMQKVFIALAKRSPDIDPNGDSLVTAKELQDFCDRNIKSGMGNLIYASSPDETIFGWWDYLNMLPIVGTNGRELNFPERYMPSPS